MRCSPVKQRHLRPAQIEFKSFTHRLTSWLHAWSFHRLAADVGAGLLSRYGSALCVSPDTPAFATPCGTCTRRQACPDYSLA